MSLPQIKIVLGLVVLAPVGFAFESPAAGKETGPKIVVSRSTGPGSAQGAPSDPETIAGSGKHITKAMKIADFTAVEVSGPFQIEVSRADSFTLVISADDNLIDLVKAVKDGTTLKIAVNAGAKPWRATQLNATITMPSLQGVVLGGATHGSLKGFESTGPFTATVTGASSLEGKVEAGKVELSAVGASAMTLKGSAKEATLSAEGASQLFLGDFALETATVTLTGASTAAVKVKEKLDYVLSGAAKLEYQGNPSLGKRETSGVSSASSK